jgi:hypothetical protein
MSCCLPGRSIQRLCCCRLMTRRCPPAGPVQALQPCHADIVKLRNLVGDKLGLCKQDTVVHTKEALWRLGQFIETGLDPGWKLLLGHTWAEKLWWAIKVGDLLLLTVYNNFVTNCTLWFPFSTNMLCVHLHVSLLNNAVSLPLLHPTSLIVVTGADGPQDGGAAAAAAVPHHEAAGLQEPQGAAWPPVSTAGRQR